ncbi:MAG: RNA polymerase sigma factor [Verrucomicrobiota bacterium]
MNLPPPENLSDVDQTRWFTDEVRAHESSLRSYLRGSFPTVRDVDDVVQESFLRIWKARAGQPIQSARAFLFRVARNLALDVVRRRRVAPVEAVGELAELRVVDERPGAAETLNAQEKLAVLTDALDALPVRCREAIILCKLQGKSYREAAMSLGIAEKTIAEHVYRGTQRLGEELNKRGIDRFGT